MSATDIIEKWHEKCRLAHEAQERYDQYPTPTNYSELQQALHERGLIEEEMDPGATHSHRA